MNKLQTSKYLQTIKRKNDYAVYHSLFGNLSLLDAEGYKLLQSFNRPLTSSEVISTIPKYDPVLLIHYINNLLSKGFLTIEGADEYALIEKDYQYRKKNLHNGYLLRALQLVMTNKCNFNCDYCFVKTMYNSEERSILQYRATNMNMSFETAKTAIEKLIKISLKNGNQELYVEFFGGEPLLNWEVIKQVLNTFKDGKTCDVTFQYSITTNGSIITAKMAEVFKKYGVTVTVSVDSFALNEKSQSSCAKGNGRVEQGLKILKEKENWVTFNSVISKETLDKFDECILIEKAQHYNVAMIGLILDLDLAFYKSTANIETALQKLWKTYRLGQQEGIAVVGYWHQIFQQIIGKQATRLSSGYKTCPAAGCKLSIEPEGHVFICKCCSTRIGHINDMEKILHSPLYKTYALQAYRNAPECAGCEIEGFCSGVCMGTLEKRFNRIDTIENNICTIYKKITRKLIENINVHEAVTLPLAQSGKKQ